VYFYHKPAGNFLQRAAIAHELLNNKEGQNSSNK
jgi:hypothetical protein